MPGKILRTLFAREAPVRFRPCADPAMWRWIARWLRECRLERYRANKLRMQRLAFYSRGCLHRLRSELEIDYEQSQGYLQLFRTTRDLDLAAPAAALLRENNVPHRLVSAQECRRIEPGLAADTPLAGGLHLPEDESGNCPMFVRALHRHAGAAEQTGESTMSRLLAAAVFAASLLLSAVVQGGSTPARPTPTCISAGLTTGRRCPRASHSRCGSGCAIWGWRRRT